MKNKMKALVLFFAIATSQAVYSQEISFDSEKSAEIKNYIKHFEDSNQLMGTVSIFQNGREVINETFGKRNIKTGSLEERKYAIGSTTKLFVGVLFAKLKEDNRISFVENLSNYFPEIPNANKISIRQMLNHTSGLRDYVSKGDSLHFWLTKPRATEEIMDEIISAGVAFQPGDSFEYSNSAYYLLGKILEEKYNKSFSQIIQDEISAPLNLENTFVIDDEAEQNSIAKSYEQKKGEWVEVEEFYFPNTFSAGGIASTAFDLNTLLVSLFNQEIIKDKTLKAMLPMEDDWFGLGIMKAPFYEHTSYGHGGDTYGTHSVAMYNPSNRLAVTYMINGEHYPTNDFAIGLLSIMYGKEYTLPDFKEYKGNEKYFELYEGNYGAEGFPMNVKIYVEEGELKAQAEGQPSFTLTPTEKHVFEFSKAGIEIGFKPFENTLILNQGGQVFELKQL
ncbi:serine hydrolase domain-containing protein [Marivirga sericea]|nr:serine hydrolase domain-containing protein [Marivirga sericea]